MKPIVLTLILVLYKGAFCERIVSGFVLLNQPYTFPGNASACRHAEWRKIHPTDTTITTYNNPVCTTGKGLEEELRCEDERLLLKSAKYTDQGSYEFICDGVKTSLHLDVLYAVDVSAAETDSITLNCYAHTTKDVKWLHNRESVLHYKIDGSLNSSKDYEGRASLENNCFKTGDFSLTIARVRTADAGIYRCFVDDETVKGIPQASVLHVNEKRSRPGDQTHCSCILYKNIIIGLAGILGILVAAFVIYRIIFKQREHQSGPATVTQSGEVDHMLLLPVIIPKTPICESQPTEESSFTANKTSTTKPFKD